MDSFGLFCCRSCLRDDDREFYRVLGLEDHKNASIDDVKRAYKKASLNLHPDKLAQRGVEVTAEHRQQFLKVKEAYDVLSDPKRKKIYDEVGGLGLKFSENPQEVSYQEVLRNFQKNRGDRFSIGILVAFIVASLLVLPVLFSLKCDALVGSNVPWLALWTPMWIVDGFMLIAALLVFAQQQTEEDNEETKIPLLEKISNLITTLLFILLQIFILMRLDGVVEWNWFAAFAPWFAYEFLTVLALFPSAFCTSIKPPNLDEVTVEDVEEGHNPEEELLFKKIKLEGEYFQKAMNQEKERKSILVCVLRAWLGVFLALKVNSDPVDWNWGLVLLPIWVYLFMQYLFACYVRKWGHSVMETVNIEVLMADPENQDPVEATKAQAASMLSTAAGYHCLAQASPLFMAILLVSRLTGAHISTFIIILPVFIGICLCCCGVSTVLCCLSCIPVDGLEQPLNHDQHPEPDQERGPAGPSATTINEVYEPPSTVHLPPEMKKDVNPIATDASQGTAMPSPAAATTGHETSGAHEAVATEEQGDFADIDD